LGAEVTLLDASPKQLVQDEYVAKRENLDINTDEGDMANLSAFEDGRFELIFNPPSTMFVPELAPVWHECYRVLNAGGLLMTGFMNPDEFIFDYIAIDEKGVLEVKYSLPFVEHETLSQEVLEQRIQNKEMFHFSHSMETQLGGLMKAGFVITDFYEDRRPEEDGNPIRHYMPTYYVARAQKVRFTE
jgi:ubiquinone/menaquinone biosynthesis C-methylase UbiE